MYFRIERRWHLQVKTVHDIHLDIKEGFWRDTLSLYVDNILLVRDTASPLHLKDYALFDIDGRTHELRWVWGLLEGFPLSIVIIYKGRILAQYGDGRAASDAWFEEQI